MKIKYVLLTGGAAGVLALTGVGVASAATPAPTPPISATAAPGSDIAGPGDTPDAPGSGAPAGAADQAGAGDQADPAGQGEQPDTAADGPGGHADPVGADVNGTGGTQT